MSRRYVHTLFTCINGSYVLTPTFSTQLETGSMHFNKKPLTMAAVLFTAVPVSCILPSLLARLSVKLFSDTLALRNGSTWCH